MCHGDHVRIKIIMMLLGLFDEYLKQSEVDGVVYNTNAATQYEATVLAARVVSHVP